MGSNSDRAAAAIDLGKQRFALQGPALITAAIILVGAGAGYTQLAPKSYVDETTKANAVAITALTEAQTTSVATIEKLSEAQAKDRKRMGLVVRLVSAQYIAHVEDEESKPQRQRNRPRSSKAKKVAAALQFDPDDPLAGLELTDMLEQTAK